MTSLLIWAGDSLDMGRAQKGRRILNQLSYRLTFIMLPIIGEIAKYPNVEPPVLLESLIEH